MTATHSPTPFAPVRLEHASRLINHGPTVLVTAAHGGRINLMAAAWSMPVEFTPPRIAVVIDKRTFTHELVMATGRFGVCVPGADLLDATYGVGVVSGRDVDKFATCGLTPLPAALVAAPLIAECYASLECRVTDRQLVDSYNFFVLEVVKAWIDPAIKDPRTLHHRGRGAFMVAGETIRLRSKMK